MPPKRTWKLTKPRRPDGHWESVILPKAAEIVRGYGHLGIGLRGLFYQLVTAGDLYNSANEYTYLSRRVTDARYAGTFPDLIDESREIRRSYRFYSSLESFKQHLEYVKKSYQKYPTEGQPYSIYLGVEKRGMVEQLYSWFGEDLGIPVLPFGGYASYQFIKDVARHWQYGYDTSIRRPAVLIYAGDFDPSGMDIPTSFLEQLRRQVDVEYKFTEYKFTIEFVRVALTFEQSLSLPQNKIDPENPKQDSRAAGFEREWGDAIRAAEKDPNGYQVELDALPPDVLRELFQREINKWWDDAAYQRVLEQEAKDRESLT